MSIDPKDDRWPRILVNKSAWRGATIVLLITALALAAALVAKESVEGSGRATSGGTDSDLLTTLALALAILAFLIQIFVYQFQTRASRRTEERADELSRASHTVLDEIRANSEATQKVLFSQFDRLLDYVVAPAAKPPVSLSDEEREDEEGDVADAEESRPATVNDLRSLLAEAVGGSRIARPVFSTPADMNLRDDPVLQYLRSGVTMAEAEEAVEKLRTLSPLGLAKLVRFIDREIRARQSGSRIGLRINRSRGDVSPTSRELIDAGFVQRSGDILELTDEGRAKGRLLASKSSGELPTWWDEVMAPLLSRPSGS